MKIFRFLLIALAAAILLSGCSLFPSAIPEAPGTTLNGGAQPGGNTADISNVTPAQTQQPAVNQPTYEIAHANAQTYDDGYGSIWVRTIVALENTGAAPLYLGYNGSFDLEDSSGRLVGSESYVYSYPNVIQPGETGYMYYTSYYDNITSEMSLNVIPHPDVQIATVEDIRLPVSDVTITDDEYWGVNMLGRVENDTNVTQSDLTVVAFLFDASGNIIDIMETYLSNELVPGEKMGFEMYSYAPGVYYTTNDVANIVAFGYPYQYQY